MNTITNMNAAKPGLEVGTDGELIGRDPRKMTPAELNEIGHQQMSPIKALRLRCLDCCAGSGTEVRLCTAVACPSWPFRMGENPYRTKRTLSEEHRQKLAASRRSSLTEGIEREVAFEGTEVAPEPDLPENRGPDAGFSEGSGSSVGEVAPEPAIAL